MAQEGISAQVRPLLVYFYFLGVAILYYDHLLTLGAEVVYIWSRPKTLSSYWFFLNRYLAFSSSIPITVFYFISFNAESCRKYAFFRQIVLVVQEFGVGILLALRVYALYDRSRRILIILCCVAIIISGICGWSLTGQKSTPAPEDGGLGCFISLSKASAIHIASAWEALFVYDIFVFSATIFRTYHLRFRYRISASDIPITALILRDGAMYFAMMALVNLSNIITFYVGDPFFKGCLSGFASSVSVTMMSRLMLNLHEVADVGLYSTGGPTETLDFRAAMRGVDLDD